MISCGNFRERRVIAIKNFVWSRVVRLLISFVLNFVFLFKIFTMSFLVSFAFLGMGFSALWGFGFVAEGSVF